MPEIPFKKYLAREIVVKAVGGRRELERLEAEGSLRRYYPCTLRRARYLRSELMNLLESVRAKGAS